MLVGEAMIVRERGRLLARILATVLLPRLFLDLADAFRRLVLRLVDHLIEQGALRLLIGVGLDTALDVCEQIAEVAGTQLQAYTLQRMCGQRGAGRIATRYVVRKRRAESGEMAFELADEFREHPVLPGGVLDEPDLSDQLAVEQQACHSCFLR